MADPYAQLNANERRRRWKAILRVGGFLLMLLGVMLRPHRDGIFTKRDLSAFSGVADVGAFASEALACIGLGLLLVAASFLIRADLAD